MKLFKRESKSGIVVDGHEATTAAAALLVAELEVIEHIRKVGGTVHFGAPTRCPHCNAYGMVDHVDQVGGTVDNHCPSCTTTWQVTRRAIALADANGRDTETTRPIGNGILVRGLAA